MDRHSRFRRITTVGIILSALCVCLLSCSGMKVPSEKVKELTFDKIMKLEASPNMNMPIELPTIEENIERWGKYIAFVHGEVEDVEYHVTLGYDLPEDERRTYSGYTLIKFSVTQCSENEIGISKNDTITIRRDSFIKFKNADDRFAFVTGHSPIGLTEEEIIAEIDQTDSYDRVLIPIEGIEYIHLDAETEMPMKAGEAYTMMLLRLTDDSPYFSSFELPSDEFLAELEKTYGLTFENTFGKAYSLDEALKIRDMLK